MASSFSRDAALAFVQQKKQELSDFLLQQYKTHQGDISACASALDHLSTACTHAEYLIKSGNYGTDASPAAPASAPAPASTLVHGTTLAQAQENKLIDIFFRCTEGDMKTRPGTKVRRACEALRNSSLVLIVVHPTMYSSVINAFSCEPMPTRPHQIVASDDLGDARGFKPDYIAAVGMIDPRSLMHFFIVKNRKLAVVGTAGTVAAMFGEDVAANEVRETVDF